jgi:hypothetical protein
MAKERGGGRDDGEDARRTLDLLGQASLATIREKLEVLNGDRRTGAKPNAKGKAAQTTLGQSAVRLDDIKALMEVPLDPQVSFNIGSAPTAADYNKLAGDVRALYEAIAAAGEGIREAYARVPVRDK